MKRILSFLLVALMLICAVPFSSFANTSAQAEGLPFSDVKATHWFYSAVDYSYTNGIFKGTNAAGTTFSPNRTMTRIEFATTLFRLAGANEADFQGESKFPDVESNSWMTAPANWASEKGYVLGNDKGEFMPNKTLDRQTLATMLYRFAADEYDEMTARETAFERFGDKASTADWAKEAMTWVVTVELINGTGENVKGAPTLAPKMAASRAQVAQILMNYANLWYNQPYNVGDIVIGETSLSEYTVVYGSGSEDEAQEFVKYVKMATGFDLPVVADSAKEAGEKEVLIGKTNREGKTVNINRSVCKDHDTFMYGVQNGILFFTSNETKYGTYYGIFDFLEIYAGLNFYQDFETVDVKKAYYVPADLNYVEGSPTTALRVFFSKRHLKTHAWMTAESNTFHGFYHSLPGYGKDPSEFKPNWEYLVTYHKDADPCLTSPEIQQNIITNVRSMLKGTSGKSGIWIAMSDGNAYCKCSSCAAFSREHGRMGAYFNILDVVADALQKDYPNVQTVGLAYKYIWSKLTNFNAKDINKNVALVVATDNMCGSHTISSTGCHNKANPNETYVEDLGYKVNTVYGYKECFDTIAELCPNIYIWDYMYPANSNEAPIPLFHRLYENWTYFFANGAKGVFCQNHEGTNASFGLVREYMISKMMRNVGTLTEKEYWALLDECLKYYYGDGWSYIREYIDYTWELSKVNEWHIWSNEDWNDIISEEQYRENFDYLMGLWETAAELAQTEEMRYNVERDSCQMKYIEVCLAYKTYEKSAKTEEDLNAYKAVRDAYIELVYKYGFKEPNIASLNPEYWHYGD